MTRGIILTFSSWINHLFQKIINKIYSFNYKLTKSKILTYFLFRLEVLPYDSVLCQNWDFSTLILKKALNKYVRNGQRILEVGTGHLAILSIYISKNKNLDIYASDINPDYIENAKKNVIKNKVDVKLIKSDLFENINGNFDIIFFNPPYVPINWMLKNHKEFFTNTIIDLTWNGGIDGLEVIKKFIRHVKNYTDSESKILLGVNSFFIKYEKMKSIIEENGFLLDSIVSSRWNPSKTYVIKNGD